ncbi:MAG TPA: hypothetical protein VFV02_01585 [Acidimicrobiales bacterium]|nr:hypothetical protein [Acidimicrobiales bacterium]
MQLPDQGPIAAWPVVVAGDPVRVVWATGREPATVWIGTPEAGTINLRSAFIADAILGLQATPWTGGLDLLCDTLPSAARFVRVGADVLMDVAATPGASLFPGAVLTVQDQEIDIWSPDSGEHQRVRPPETKIGRRLRIIRAHSQMVTC